MLPNPDIAFSISKQKEKKFMKGIVLAGGMSNEEKK